jgi:hypothetical protein
LEDNSFHIVTTVEIDGIVGEMIIDTGASVSVIDKALCSNMLCNSDNSFHVQSASVTGKIENIEVVQADYLKIGGRKLKKVPLVAIDLKYVNTMYEKKLKRKIIGLLGCDFFVHYQVIIDYANLKLTLKLNKKTLPKH